MRKSETEKLIKQALGPEELRELWRAKLPSEDDIKVIDYDDIINSSNIDNLFNGDDRLIIFYPNYQGEYLFGHYCALIRWKNDTIYFFDSYGGLPDVDQKRFSGTQRKDLYKEDENSLINLLIDSGFDVDYSDHKLQSKNNNVATCGRWCLTRCALSHLNNDEFANVIQSLAKFKKMSPDAVVVNVFH
ncbi:PRO [Cafeteriavirus-dependent mavirus]|nr:PRO [Cafeteriavirus-dependent mavirus]CAK6624544.1 PRO [Cafeteriavirus-dependent mavirus]